MREIFARMAELEREGRRFAVATVVRTTGSTPQVVGAKLLVDDLGRLVGTLGGGCVEGDAFVEAKHVIETGEPSLREYELTEDLAWDTGLVCGGTMWISIEPGERVLRFAGRDLLGDVLASIAGGGHVGLAIAKLGVQLDYDVTVIDDRPEFANRERFPGVSEVVNMDMVKALETMPIGWNSFVIVATRGHKLDSHCLRAAVKTDARYIGLLGSKRKTILIAQMLRGEGIPEERIRAVHAPVGLDLGGRTPAEIALSVLAELSLERYGGSGRPLRISDELFERTIGVTKRE